MSAAPRSGSTENAKRRTLEADHNDKNSPVIDEENPAEKEDGAEPDAEVEAVQEQEAKNPNDESVSEKDYDSELKEMLKR